MGFKKKITCDICFRSFRSKKEFLDKLMKDNDEILFIVSDGY